MDCMSIVRRFNSPKVR